MYEKWKNKTQKYFDALAVQLPIGELKMRSWNCGNCDNIQITLPICRCGYLLEAQELCDGFPSECPKCDLLDLCDYFEDKIDSLPESDKLQLIKEIEL